MADRQPGSGGSRDGHPKPWPRCNARTRGKAGVRPPAWCRASGQGIGGRCHFHGGMALGAPIGTRRGKRPEEGRRLVLLTAWLDLLPDASMSKRARRRWQAWALPVDLINRLPSTALPSCCDAAFVQVQLERRGVPRKVAVRWPQVLGYRVVLQLAKRGRIAFALLSGSRDLRRIGGKRRRSTTPPIQRIEAGDVLAALEAAGRTKGERTT